MGSECKFVCVIDMCDLATRNSMGVSMYLSGHKKYDEIYIDPKEDESHHSSWVKWAR